MKKLFYNAIVYTGNDFQEAFIVEDNRFIFVGKSDEAFKLVEEKDEKIDLNGKFVCAGFNDSHMHLLNLGKALLEADLINNSSSKKQMYEYLERYVAENSHLNWIKGRGWNQDLFSDDKTMPDKKHLDKICNDKPTFLARACGHCVAVNSKALSLAGIDKNTASPNGGLIDFENGLLYDKAISLVKEIIDVPSLDEIKKMIVKSCEYLNSFGITSSQSDDYGTFKNVSYETINKAYKELEQENRLSVRVYEQANFSNIETLKEFVEKGNVTGKGTDMFKIGPLKMLGDGSLGSRTANLSIPYYDDPNTSGFCLYTDELMNEMVDYANSNNVQVAIHAIGDKCLDQVLNALEKALINNPRKDHRHGIVHCQISRKDQLDKMIEMKLNIYAQSVFLDYDNHIVEKRVGKDLASTSYNWKTLMDKGLNVSNGSDAPVEIPDVLKGIECAITRTSLDGTGPYLIDQAFTVKQAIDSFTINGAISSFEEKYKGLIKEGYLADFVVLESNPFETIEHDIHNIKVLNTYLGGKCVFSYK